MKNIFRKSFLYFIFFSTVCSVTWMVNMINSYAAEKDSIVTAVIKEEEVLSIAEVKDIFPEANLEEVIPVNQTGILNGEVYIVGTFETEKNGGECFLNVYNDGSAEMYGYEMVEDGSEIQPLDSGYTVSNAKYTSYYRSAIYGFSYSYTLYNALGTNYSQFHNLSGISVYGTQYAYFSVQSIGYVNQTQTASAAAQIKGVAALYSDGYYGGTYSLITRASYGSITVSLNVAA